MHATLLTVGHYRAAETVSATVTTITILAAHPHRQARTAQETLVSH